MDKIDNIFDLLEQLKDSDTQDEAIKNRVTYFLKDKAREVGSPYHGHFELTPLCNLNCKMCYVHLQKDQMGGKRLLSEKEWINLIQQAINEGMVTASLSGGECLTYPWFDEVFLYLKSRGIITSIMTNGLLLDDERIEFFKKNSPHQIKISLYGDSEEVYERVTGKRVFVKIIENIKKAKHENLPLKISITPNIHFLENIKDTIELVKSLDIPYVLNIGLMTPRCDTGRGKDENEIPYEKYIEIFKFNRTLNGKIPVPRKTEPFRFREMGYKNTGVKCGGGRSTFAIRWDGIMTPCSQMNSIFANPLKDGFQNSWKSINKEMNNYPRFIQCDECIYSNACSYCAAENEKIASKYKLSREWCERTWIMVENGLRTPEL